MNQENTKSNAEEFEQLLDEYEYERPKRGQLLEGRITTVEDDTIVLDVGTKRAAIVNPREVKNMDDELIENFSVGDKVPIQVKRTPIGDENLLVSIDDASEYQSWELVQQLLDEGTSLELDVTAQNKGGLLVQFEELEGFVPNSHIPALKNVYDRKLRKKLKREMIGGELQVKPIRVNPRNKKLVFSASAAQQERQQERLRELEVGEVIEGLVVNVVNFGAFVDLNGADGLLHVSEMDWITVENPADVVSVGDTIEVEIIGIDLERERIKLSRKTLLPNPWDVVAARYIPGSLVEVVVTNVVDFGAFCELPEGIQGLIHQTELGYTAYQNGKDEIEPGTKVLVKVLRVDAERERISLSMRQVPVEKQLDWMLNDTEQDKNEDT